MPRPAHPNALQAESGKGWSPPFLSHTGVLAHLLSDLGGRQEAEAQSAHLLLIDPAFALRVLELFAQAHAGASLSAFTHADLLKDLDTCTLKSIATSAATEFLTRPTHSNQDATWRLAIRGAVLSRMLAEKIAYPSPDEAWLAGLLLWLPGFVADTGLDPAGARQCAQDALDRLPLRTFLPDALRYLDEPAQRLSDAAPLVQLTVAAHRLVPLCTSGGLNRFNLPLLDDLFFTARISQENLLDMLNTADMAVEALYTENGRSHLGEMTVDEMAFELIRYNQLELAANAMRDSEESAILTLANLLASQEGITAPIYLKRNPHSGYLEAQALGAHAAPPISIRITGGKAAAARALLTRATVCVLQSAPGDAAVIDLQLIHQADADGLAAIPLGDSDNQGVLLVRGNAASISTLAALPEHYARMGWLAGRAKSASSPGAAGNAANGRPDGLPARVHRATHEINNPLGIIKNYLAILKVKLGDDAPVSDELRIIYEELDRIVGILRGLAHEEAEPRMVSETADINALIQDLVKVTQPTWQNKGIQVSTLLTPGLSPISGSRDKLKQIVLNLLLNAIEATPPGGIVRMETAALANFRHQHFIEILVADSGSGISPEVASRLFDPLETAKGNGHAGLGLSIVKSLTQSMQGDITFKTGASGTTFQISLPTN